MNTLSASFSSPARSWVETPSMASASADRLDPHADFEVASKVLRRAQVSKMTRQLQNRLALANVKIKHGWQNLSIDSIEPQIEMELKRKRRDSTTNATISETSSSTSDRFHPQGALDSSPLAPIFSDQVHRSGSSSAFNGKRSRYHKQDRRPASSSHNRTKVRTQHVKATSWKSSHQLPESSPAYRNRHTVTFATSHAPTLSFVSETTVADDNDGSLASEDDDADLPLHSFHASSGPQIHSSPPRTPPPEIAHSARLRSKPFTSNDPNSNNNGEEGAADLLMFLAASPSPAQPTPSRTLTRTPHIQAPSTPPAKATPLPSSMMNTPGGTSANFLGFGTATPGMASFNFADYLNVTPSPGQAAWKTPGPAKTPLAAREARRRLNFDSLMPPGGSPTIQEGKAHGLGMELGGELVSSQ